MKTSNFRYKVHIEVLFTDEEFNVIELCMLAHYDGCVKAAAAHGGFLYGWKNHRNINMRSSDDRTLTCSFEQLDICAKAIEMPTHITENYERETIRFRLAREIKSALQSINAETRRRHGEG